MSGLFYFIFIFVIYSFLGWCLEEVFSYFVLGYFKKEGFLSVPFKPMYGIAISILVYMYEVLDLSKAVMTIFFIVIPTTVEYISGYLLKKYFDKVYWDYNDIKYNFQGLICLRFSLAWIGLSALTIFAIQPVISRIYLTFQGVLKYVAMILAAYIVIDFIEITFNKCYKKVP